MPDVQSILTSLPGEVKSSLLSAETYVAAASLAVLTERSVNDASPTVRAVATIGVALVPSLFAMFRTWLKARLGVTAPDAIVTNLVPGQTATVPMPSLADKGIKP